MQQLLNRRASKLRWNRTHPDRMREYSRRWAKSHPEHFKKPTVRATAAKWRENNRERLRQNHINWRNAHPSAWRAIQRRSHEKNRVKIRERNRIYRQEHKIQQRDYGRAWRSLHPEFVRAAARRRRVRELRAEGFHTVKQWLLLCAKYGHHCAHCGELRKLTEDHIIPLSRGGSDFISNIQPLCLSCNQKKGTRVEKTQEVRSVRRS